MSDYPEEYRERLRQMVNDPAFTAAVDHVKTGLYEEWSDQTDAMERDQIFHTRKGLERLLNRMHNLAASG